MNSATSLSNRARWLWVFAYAVGMAWVESAVVLYLRTLVGRLDPYQRAPLPLFGNLGNVELVREAATLLMLLAIGVLAGKNWRSRLGYSAIAFGVWDIFYYIFLKMMCGWPKSLLNWDVLFLLPLPWWGPVLAPMLIAFLMILWGTLATNSEDEQFGCAASWACWTTNALGILVALYVFMADAIRIAPQGEAAIREMLPTEFQWPLFMLALAFMAAPIARSLFRLTRPWAPLQEIRNDEPIVSGVRQ